MQIFGLAFAPFSVPLERRLQTLAVLYALIEYSFGFLSSLLVPYLLFTKYYYVPILYFTWLFYDRNCCRKGGRIQPWFRKLTLFKYYVRYFPITLEKTAELDSKKNYIFGYHPHGILATGAFGNFGTEGTGFSKVFPGITPRIVTLGANFWLPIHRDLSLFRGLISSERESIEWVLSKCGTGNAVVLVIGGAAESMDAVPDTMKLTLKSRKGFVKIALRQGADLVPVISFGENEIYTQAPRGTKSKTRKIQKFMKNLFRFTIPIFHGRGIFQYTMGLLPFRTPIHTIVGKPIAVTQISDPTEEQVNELHNEYMDALTKLFKENKDKYARDPRLELELQ